MYYIENGLGKKPQPLSIMFSLAGLVGCTVMFQSNQLADIIRNQVFIPNGWFENNLMMGNLVQGLIMAILTALVILEELSELVKLPRLWCQLWLFYTCFPDY